MMEMGMAKEGDHRGGGSGEERRRATSEYYQGEFRPANPSAWPVGFKFKPTPQEIITEFLIPKVHGRDDVDPDGNVIDVDVYEHHPDELAWEYAGRAHGGVWYYFTPRKRKYGNGERPDREAKGGFWKPRTKEKKIKGEDGKSVIGTERSLVFFKTKDGRKDEKKTDWLMVEYTIKDARVPLSDHSMKLDEYVLCKIYIGPGGPGRKRSRGNRGGDGDGGGSKKKGKKKASAATAPTDRHEPEPQQIEQQHHAADHEAAAIAPMAQQETTTGYNSNSDHPLHYQQELGFQYPSNNYIGHHWPPAEPNPVALVVHQAEQPPFMPTADQSATGVEQMVGFFNPLLQHSSHYHYDYRMMRGEEEITSDDQQPAAADDHHVPNVDHLECFDALSDLLDTDHSSLLDYIEQPAEAITTEQTINGRLEPQPENLQPAAEKSAHRSDTYSDEMPELSFDREFGDPSANTLAALFQGSSGAHNQLNSFPANNYNSNGVHHQPFVGMNAGTGYGFVGGGDGLQTTNYSSMANELLLPQYYPQYYDVAGNNNINNFQQPMSYNYSNVRVTLHYNAPYAFNGSAVATRRHKGSFHL